MEGVPEESVTGVYIGWGGLALQSMRHCPVEESFEATGVPESRGRGCRTEHWVESLLWEVRGV